MWRVGAKLEEILAKLELKVWLTNLLLGGHKKSKFLGLISSQVNPILFMYLRHPVKYFCQKQSGSAALIVVIFQ